MATARLGAALRWLLRAPVHLYRWNCGSLLGRRFLLLTHVGRRTGRRHQTVLEILDYRDAGPEVVVMTGFGRGADWSRNIQAVPAAEVVVGTQRFAAAHRILDVPEAERVFAQYQQRNRWVAPIMRMVLSRLLGWRYDGSDGARRRAVAQLPLVAFRPRSDDPTGLADAALAGGWHIHRFPPKRNGAGHDTAPRHAGVSGVGRVSTAVGGGLNRTTFHVPCFVTARVRSCGHIPTTIRRDKRPSGADIVG